jgi:glycosyltransferase involved in cell wall biosynthesis
LIGEGPLRADVEAQVARLQLAGHVHLLGARADVERILPALDAFVLSSSTEGLSNAILEAQACALPLRDHPGAHHLVKHRLGRIDAVLQIFVGSGKRRTGE